MRRINPTSTTAASTALPSVTASTSDAVATAAGVDDQIAHLTRQVDQLWRTEPDVAPSHRTRLLERLARLENTVVRLSLQHDTGEVVDGALLLACHAEADELRWWWRPTGRDGGRRAA